MTRHIAREPSLVAPTVRRRGALVTLLVAVSFLANACGGAATPSPVLSSPTPPGSATGTPSPSPTPQPLELLTVGLGFIPSVQFAPFYLAQQAGYYAEVGLQVEFIHRIDPELITLVGQGAIDVGIGDGTSVIPAVSQGIPIRYLFTVFADFPNVVFAKAASGIGTPADLAGRRIGIPGRFGSSWIYLQALLASAGLSPADVEIVTFPDFGQRVALEEGVVDAATGFVNNEPVRLELAGTPTVVLTLPDDAQLPGNGLIAGEITLATRPDAVRAFIAATRRAMDEIAADPEWGLAAAISRIPELAEERDAQRAVLLATIDAWQNNYTLAHGTGAVDPAIWERSIAFMSGLPESPVARPVTVGEVIAPEFAGR
jgi:NitT/TauT family transport system substrate-binding protein